MDKISDVWPNLEVFFHGGISFEPYRDEYRKITDSGKMHFQETYNASEGFFAVQNDFSENSMLLIIDRDVFYEFIPVDEITAAIRSVFNARVQSVAYTLGKSLAVFFVVPFQKHFIYFAALVVADWLGCRNYPYAVLLFQLRFVHYTVNAVSGKPIKLVNDNMLECTFVCVAYHFLKVWSVIIRSRPCLVHIGLYDSKPLALGILGANAYLPLDRLLVLSL